MQPIIQPKIESNYDFETMSDRHASSSKWHNMHQYSYSLVHDVVPLSTADMEFRLAPEIVDAICRYASSTILGYSYMNDSFISSYIDWMERQHNYKVLPQSLVPASGVVTSIFAAVRAFTEKGDAVMVMPPVYGPFFLAVQRTNRRLVECPLVQEEEGHYEMDFGKMEELFKKEEVKALIFCSPHNPVGRVWSGQELARLSELCVKYDVFVIADEIHHDMALEAAPCARPHTVLETVNDELKKRIITSTSLSKTFNLAGMSLAISVIPDRENKEKFEAELAKNPDHTVNGIAYTAYEAAYTKGLSWLEDVLKVIASNLNFAASYIKQNIPSVKTYVPEGTYLLWMDFSQTGLSGVALDEFLKFKAKLHLTPGSSFGGEAYNNFARMNVAAPRHVIEAALARLKKALITI